MNRTRSIAIAALMALSAASAFSDGPKTREQVRAELADARRTGNIIGVDEAGLNLNEMYPQRYPATAAGPSKTRAEVVEELAAARRSGDIVANGETGLLLNELYPQLYPAPVHVAGRSRADVRAELAEARRLGEVGIGEDSLTPAERNPAQYAKARATRGADSQQLAGGQAEPKAAVR